MKPSKLFIQWLPTKMKQPNTAAGHSLKASAEVKNVWSFISTPPYVYTE
jgi:hypothetical protein